MKKLLEPYESRLMVVLNSFEEAIRVKHQETARQVLPTYLINQPAIHMSVSRHYVHDV